MSCIKFILFKGATCNICRTCAGIVAPACAVFLWLDQHFDHVITAREFPFLTRETEVLLLLPTPCQCTAANRGGWIQLHANANVPFKIDGSFLTSSLDIVYQNADGGILCVASLLGQRKFSAYRAELVGPTRNRFVLAHCKTAPPSSEMISRISTLNCCVNNKKKNCLRDYYDSALRIYSR